MVRAHQNASLNVAVIVAVMNQNPVAVFDIGHMEVTAVLLTGSFLHRIHTRGYAAYAPSVEPPRKFERYALVNDFIALNNDELSERLNAIVQKPVDDYVHGRMGLIVKVK
jgi:hypothetical protein